LKFLLARKAKMLALKTVNQRLWMRTKVLRDDLNRQNEFLHMAVHDLRSPLAAMVCYAELLMDGVLGNIGSSQLEPIRIIHRNCKFLIDMVTDLLDSARLGAGKLQLKLEKTDFRKEVEASIASLRSLADNKNIRVEMDLRPVPEVFLDLLKFERVITNLLGNAIKFTKPGGKITVRAESRDDLISLSIQDTGPGIPAAEWEAIFKKFELGTTESIGGKGHGLGLAISKSFVEMHGGRLFVESTRGKGSVFVVHLPVEKRTLSDVQEKDRRKRKLLILDMADDLPGLEQVGSAIGLESLQVEYLSSTTVAGLDWGLLRDPHFDILLINEAPASGNFGWDYYSTLPGVMNADEKYMLIPSIMPESDRDVRRSHDFSIWVKPCTLPELILKLRGIVAFDRRRNGV
jgi:nitrogen-specific signal transduction histidine kinase